MIFRAIKCWRFGFWKDCFKEESLAIWYQDDGCLKSEFTIDRMLFWWRVRDFVEVDWGKIWTQLQRKIDIHTRRDVELFLCYVSPYKSNGMKRKSLMLMRSWPNNRMRNSNGNEPQFMCHLKSNKSCKHIRLHPRNCTAVFQPWKNWKRYTTLFFRR